MRIRPEGPEDAAVIRALTAEAFAGKPYASGTESAIVDALRDADALTLSLVAVDHDGQIVGHVAVSAVTAGDAQEGWYGLGPLSVRLDRQRAGVGGALVAEALAALTQAGAKGCVLVGDPAYYSRFGFTSDPAITYPGVPQPYLQRLIIDGPAPEGEIAFHTAFSTA